MTSAASRLHEPTRLVLVRHGETEWNATGRLQGQLDVELNTTGLLQAQAMAPVVAQYHPVALYSSDSQRTVQTASFLAEQLRLPIITDPRLREVHVGSWGGLDLAEVSELDPDFGPALARGEDRRRSPEGENGAEVAARIRPALDEIAQRHPGLTTVIVSHGFASRMAVMSMLGWDYRTAFSLGGLWNCAWGSLIGDGSTWRLECYNRAAPRHVS